MKNHDVKQGTDEWHALRAGIPTASEFSKLVTSKGEPSKSIGPYSITLAGEKFAGKPLDAWEGNQWSERGKEHEDAAIALYEMIYDCDIKRLGFVTTNDGTMGCSPDGVVENQNIGIEVKCLKAETHIKAILYYQAHATMPPDYVQQTQGQMMICEWKWADLIFYHPDLPMLVITAPPDRMIQAALVQQIDLVGVKRDEIHAGIIRHEDGEG